jgi:exosome complex RNA-binding protein Rrp4
MGKTKTDFDVVNNATEMQVTLSASGYLYVRAGERGRERTTTVVILTAKQLRRLARIADRMAEVRERCEAGAAERVRAQDIALLG